MRKLTVCAHALRLCTCKAFKHVTSLFDSYAQVDAAKKAGFEVVAVGVDRNSAQSEKFAKQFDPVYPVALDPDAMTMGLFNINAMPTSFLVDRKGIIRHREVGFKKDEVALLQRRIQKVLEEK